METAAADPTATSFETALARLEQIVRALEAGDSTLEDSLRLYSEGDTLRRFCEARLSEAQARIEQLQIDRQGQVTGTSSFDAG